MPSARIAFLVGPLLIFLGATYLVPFLGVMRWSVTMPEVGLGQYRAALTDPLVLSVFLRTLRICAIVTVLSVAAAYVITLVWVRGSPLARLLTEVGDKTMLSVPVPDTVLRMAGQVLDRLGPFLPFQTPFTEAGMQYYTQMPASDDTPSERDLGVTYRDPRITLADTVAGLRALER